jgi:hypothetical protein
MTVTTEQHAPAGKAKRRNTRRGIKIVAIAGGLALVGGTAFAFWTQSGTGSGSATTDTTSALTVNQTGTISGLAPGVAPIELAGTFDNPNAGSVRVHAISVTISSVTGGAGACSAADYTVVSPSALDVDVPSGDGVSPWHGGSIVFKNDPILNQDGCKGATVHLAFASS